MRKEKLSTDLIAFFALLIFLFTGEIETRTLGQQICSSSCGDIRNITYPFRLKGNPAGCGDSDYQLSCENNRTILEFVSTKYYVTQISYEMKEIRIADVNFANGTCNLPYKSLSGEELHGDFRFRGFTFNQTVASFMNCSTIISDPAYTRLPCLRGSTSSVYVFCGRRTLSNLPLGCNFMSTIPIYYDSSLPENPSYEAVLNLLESGFNLGSSVECRDCLQSNSYCVFDAIGPLPYKYYCEKPDRSIPRWLIIFSSVGIALIVLGRFIAPLIIILVFLILKYRKERKPVDNVEMFLRNHQSLMPKRYSYANLIAMTNHFRDKLGQGGFGSVYKGQLPGGLSLAVKMLENTKFSVDEFINEVSTMGRTHHVNVVQLLGFCSEGSNRALVYEYMSNGSLDKHIFSKEGKAQSFSWQKLFEIALGTARGIEYLHNGCDVCILHFDIKPGNILLDPKFVPKVADFGLAKFYPKEKDFVTRRGVIGTRGYIAPELVSSIFGSVSSKSDVYSFGMLLLEIAGGRKNVDEKAENPSRVYFPSWVYDRLDRGGDLELGNVTETENEIAKKLCIVGLWCIQSKASDRPLMTKVVEMLEGNIDDLEMPRKPFSSSPTQSSLKEQWEDFSTEEDSSDSLTHLLSDAIEECL